MDFKHPLGVTSLVVILLTFFLFALALFTKGWTHDLLLEAGVFLVSVKLIIMSFKNTVAVETIDRKLDEILTESGNAKLFARTASAAPPTLRCVLPLDDELTRGQAASPGLV